MYAVAKFYNGDKDFPDSTYSDYKIWVLDTDDMVMEKLDKSVFESIFKMIGENKVWGATQWGDRIKIGGYASGDVVILKEGNICILLVNEIGEVFGSSGGVEIWQDTLYAGKVSSCKRQGVIVFNRGSSEIKLGYLPLRCGMRWNIKSAKIRVSGSKIVLNIPLEKEYIGVWESDEIRALLPYDKRGFNFIFDIEGNCISAPNVYADAKFGRLQKDDVLRGIRSIKKLRNPSTQRLFALQLDIAVPGTHIDVKGVEDDSIYYLRAERLSDGLWRVIESSQGRGEDRASVVFDGFTESGGLQHMLDNIHQIARLNVSVLE